MTTVTKAGAKAKRPRPFTGPREKKGPYVLACGCDSTGHCCSVERQLGDRLDAAVADWERRRVPPGHSDFEQIYRPLLCARRDYHEHFGQRYDARADGLVQDHQAALQGRIAL